MTEDEKVILLRDAGIAIQLTDALGKRILSYNPTSWSLNSSAYINEMAQSLTLFNTVIAGLLELRKEEVARL